MELGTIAGSVLSIGSGGIFGLIGSIVGVGAKYFQERQRQKFEQAKWDHENKLLELQMQAKQQETEQELAIVSQEGSWSGLRESVKADAAIGPVSSGVNGVRALFRPFITLCLWALAAWVFYKMLSGDLRTWMSVTEMKEIIQYMVYTVFFCASSATLWWFGDRALSPPGMKNR